MEPGIGGAVSETECHAPRLDHDASLRRCRGPTSAGYRSLRTTLLACARRSGAISEKPLCPAAALIRRAWMERVILGDDVGLVAQVVAARARPRRARRHREHR